MKDLWTTIIEHGKKMVSVAKMKCNQREKDRNEREKDRSYAMQAEIRASLRSLGAEKRQSQEISPTENISLASPQACVSLPILQESRVQASDPEDTALVTFLLG